MPAKTVSFVKSAFGPRDYLRDGRPQIAFAGRSNVGKSSLINALLGRKNLARASKTPGRTREINYFLVDDAFYFVDLPGYGYAKVAQAVSASWGKLVETYARDNAALRAVILLLDARRTPSDLDLELVEWIESVGAPYIPVLTKRDKLSNNEFAVQERKARETLGREEPLLAFSAKTGSGRAELWREIERRARGG